MKLLLCFMLIPISIFSQDSSTLSYNSDSEEKNIQIVRTYWEEVWNKGNLKAVEDFYHPNAIHGEDFTIEGFQKGVRFMRAAFPDFKVTVDDIFAKNDRVISRVTYTGTHTGKKMFGQESLGNEVKVPGLDIFTIKEGKCIEHQHVADHLDLVLQMGIKLAPVKDPNILEQEVLKAGWEYNELMKRLKSGKDYSELVSSGDIEALERILADEFSYTSRDGIISNKVEDIESYKSNKIKINSAELSDQRVRMIGDNAAVETGKIRYIGINDGNSFDMIKRYTTTWVWRSGRWQIISDHTSKVE